jgi:thiol-disulfide isomerase/thioredoxin
MVDNPVVTTRPTGRLGAFAAAVILVLTITACSGNKPGPTPASCPKPKGITSVGETIPKDCVLERLEGGTLRLGALVGKPAVINFWAAWCTFCIAEMPDFDRVFASTGNRVSFVGADLLNVDGETKALAKSFAAKTKVTYPLVYDADGLLYGHFSAQLIMPVTIFVNAKGVVAFRQFGPLNEKQIRDLLREKLKVT